MLPDLQNLLSVLKSVLKEPQRQKLWRKQLEAAGDGADLALGHLNSYGNNILSLKSGNPLFLCLLGGIHDKDGGTKDYPNLTGLSQMSLRAHNKVSLLDVTQ